MQKLTVLLVSLSCIAALYSCTNEDLLRNNSLEDNVSISSDDIDTYLTRFSEILSTASYNNPSIIEFLKISAEKRIDTQASVFYPYFKNHKVGTSQKSFRDILIEYANSEGELSEIENKVPLLNIYIPEYSDIKVSNLDILDSEIPILHNGDLYINGKKEYTLSDDEIPNFHILSVCESSTICLNDVSTRSASDISLNSKYKYIHKAFVPKKALKTRAEYSNIEYENLEGTKYAVYDNKLKVEDLDPTLISSYKKSIKSGLGNRGARTIMYYNDIDHPSKIANPDVRDCIFRIKIGRELFKELKDKATGARTLSGKIIENKYFFKDKTTQKKYRPERNVLLNRLLTGHVFTIQFYIVSSLLEDDKATTHEIITISATPDKLFNLRIKESKRHKTAFRHSKYTHSIDETKVESKWYYPLDHGFDTRLNRWNTDNGFIKLLISPTLINPDEGFTAEVNESFTSVNIKKSKIKGDTEYKNDSLNLKSGISGEYSKETNNTEAISVTYKVSQKHFNFNAFHFDFFTDYPIESIDNDGFTITNRLGKGGFEISVLPISNKFYNNLLYTN